jgi:hypothetical protein
MNWKFCVGKRYKDIVVAAVVGVGAGFARKAEAPWFN